MKKLLCILELVCSILLTINSIFIKSLSVDLPTDELLLKIDLANNIINFCCVLFVLIVIVFILQNQRVKNLARKDH